MKTRTLVPRSTKARKAKVVLTSSQQEVLDVFKTYGIALPDHALVPLAQHAMHSRQSSSGIRSRRSELVYKGLLTQTGTTTTGSGRKAAVYSLV
jgi:hypothetical protein